MKISSQRTDLWKILIFTYTSRSSRFFKVSGAKINFLCCQRRRTVNIFGVTCGFINRKMEYDTPMTRLPKTRIKKYIHNSIKKLMYGGFVRSVWLFIYYRYYICSKICTKKIWSDRSLFSQDLLFYLYFNFMGSTERSVYLIS